MGEGNGGRFAPKGVTDIRVCVSAATLPIVPTTIAKTSWDAAQGDVRQSAGDARGLVPCVGRVGVIEARRSFMLAVALCCRPSQSAR